MFIRSASLVFALTLAASTAPAFQGAAGKQALQQKVTQLKESVAANKAKLQQYQWTETSTVILKDKTRKTETKLCRYGPDGKVQKTLVGPPPEQPEQQHGLKGRIVEKKTEEMKDYAERLKSLIGEYVPPARDKIQDAFQSGNASFDVSQGGSALVFKNYYKNGDKMTFNFDSTTKKISNLTVNTYLDDPNTDVVTLSAVFATLPDGTNHVDHTDLKAQSKQLEIKTANSNYQKIGQ
jgi:hypothetical protein